MYKISFALPALRKGEFWRMWIGHENWTWDMRKCIVNLLLTFAMYYLCTLPGIMGGKSSRGSFTTSRGCCRLYIPGLDCDVLDLDSDSYVHTSFDFLSYASSFLFSFPFFSFISLAPSVKVRHIFPKYKPKWKYGLRLRLSDGTVERDRWDVRRLAGFKGKDTGPGHGE